MLSGELYCRVYSLILKTEQAASLQSHLSVIQALSRKGIYVVESDGTPVTDEDLSSMPIKMVSSQNRKVVYRAIWAPACPLRTLTLTRKTPNSTVTSELESIGTKLVLMQHQVWCDHLVIQSSSSNWTHPMVSCPIKLVGTNYCLLMCLSTNRWVHFGLNWSFQSDWLHFHYSSYNS